MRVPRVGAMTVGLLGPACGSSTDESGDDTATPTSDEDRLREMACSGELPVYEVCPCEATVDWSGVTEDFWGSPVDPRAFERVGAVLILKDGSAESVADSICADTLTADRVGAIADGDAAGTTSITLPAPYEPKTDAVWGVQWSGSRDVAVDIKMAVLLEVVDDGPPTVEVVWPQ